MINLLDSMRGGGDSEHNSAARVSPGCLLGLALQIVKPYNVDAPAAGGFTTADATRIIRHISMKTYLLATCISLLIDHRVMGI